MFKENFNFDERGIDQILDDEDASALIKSWQQSPEVQEDIAEKIFTISQDEAARDLFSFFKDRYAETSEGEKNNIIKASKNLGTHNLPIHLTTTEFLAGLQVETSAETEQIVKALKGKVLNSTVAKEYLNNTKQPIPETYSKIIDVASDRLMTIIKDTEDKEIKISALSGLTNGVSKDNVTEMTKLLKDYVGGEDRKLSKVALMELFSIADPHDPYLISSLRDEIANHDFATMERNEILKFVLMARKTEDPSFEDFLNQLANDKRFKDDFEFNNYLNKAIEATTQK